jgi:hypothetical protein
VNEPVNEPVNQPVNQPPEPEDARQRAERERRRREVFGDVLDGATLDDRPDPPRSDSDATREGRDDPGERWLRENVPPHHGG